MNVPDPSPVTDLIEAFRRSKTMFAALGLGVFDLLHDGAADAVTIASELGTHADATARLLDGCAVLGLVTKRDGVYANTAAAETYLCAASPHTLRGYIRYSDEALYPMWGNLADAVSEGAPRWQQTFGLAGPIFSAFFRTDAAMREFVQGMHGFGMLTSPSVVEAFDLSAFHTFADLGGATGHLAIAACERYPGLRGILFDLPGVTALAPRHERLEVVSGDFFADPLPPADLYALGRILHDWSEEKIALLLGRIYDALPPGGAVLIAEKLLNADGVGPVAANMQSLNMLVATEGRERSAAEYAALLGASGFGEIEWRLTGTPLDAILARKPRA